VETALNPIQPPAAKLTKKERKKARAAAARAAKLVKTDPTHVTQEEVKKVAKALNEEPTMPMLVQMDGADDGDVGSPIPATPPPAIRKTKRRFSGASSQSDTSFSDKALREILKKMDVRTAVKNSSRQRHRAVTSLGAAIRKYYVWMDAERADCDMRERSFMRFAGHQAYEMIVGIVAENRARRAEDGSEGDGNMDVEIASP
jgi:hypothetical protein